MTRPSDSQQFRTDQFNADVARERRATEADTGAKVAGTIERTGQTIVQRQEAASEREFRGTEAEKQRGFTREMADAEMTEGARRFDAQQHLARQKAEAEVLFDQQRTEAYRAQTLMQAQAHQENLKVKMAEAAYNQERAKAEAAKQQQIMVEAQYAAQLNQLKQQTELGNIAVAAAKLQLQQQERDFEMSGAPGSKKHSAAMEQLRLMAATIMEKGGKPTEAQQTFLDYALPTIRSESAKVIGNRYDQPGDDRTEGAEDVYGAATPEGRRNDIADPELNAMWSELTETFGQQNPQMVTALADADSQRGNQASAFVTRLTATAWKDRAKMPAAQGVDPLDHDRYTKQVLSMSLAAAAQRSFDPATGTADPDKFAQHFESLIAGQFRTKPLKTAEGAEAAPDTPAGSAAPPTATAKRPNNPLKKLDANTIRRLRMKAGQMWTDEAQRAAAAMDAISSGTWTDEDAAVALAWARTRQ